MNENHMHYNSFNEYFLKPEISVHLIVSFTLSLRWFNPIANSGVLLLFTIVFTFKFVQCVVTILDERGTRYIHRKVSQR